MANDSLINTERFREMLVKQLNAEMLEAAEPHVQEALEKIERAMRERLAACMISMIEHRVHLYDKTDHLVIHIDKVTKP